MKSSEVIGSHRAEVRRAEVIGSPRSHPRSSVRREVIGSHRAEVIRGHPFAAGQGREVRRAEVRRADVIRQCSAGNIIGGVSPC